eukprot:CAMPEP_0182579530 /NCGR_PEP_ID=MMETSP1324-20130603/44361_1 /TAXON_ID=236786 /ORGANISM="Florenciella sp., Strain RCC1587" /LENGTH=39 /DNA_ID= /DNA_START= /DNA_END= /DNA_ORIENTATION=
MAVAGMNNGPQGVVEPELELDAARDVGKRARVESSHDEG